MPRGVGLGPRGVNPVATAAVVGTAAQNQQNQPRTSCTVPKIPGALAPGIPAEAPNKPRGAIKTQVIPQQPEILSFAFTIADDHHGGEYEVIPELPELSIVYISGANNLCKYASCLTAGDLSITLNVNGHEITVNDWDQRKGKIERLTVLGREYTFQGVDGSPYESNPKLKVIITRSALSDIISQEAGRPFTVDLDSNPSTGYSWKVETIDNLRIISDDYWSTCPPGKLGCGGMQSFTMAGLNKGPAKVTFVYSRTGGSAADNRKTYEFMII